MGFSQVEVPDTEPNYAFIVAEDSVEQTDNIINQKQLKKSMPVQDQADSYLAEDIPERDKSERDPLIDQAEPKVDELPQADLLAQQTELQTQEEEIKEDKQIEDIATDEQMASLTSAEETESLASNPTQKSLSPLEYARKVVKDDPLKNKSLSENLMDGVADITNEKIKLEKKENSP